MPESTLSPPVEATGLETAPPAIVDGPLLRRADWRVLLPVPPHGFERLILLGGPPGLAAKIVEVGLARQVREEISSEPSADAVAVLHGARARLDEVARALLPGGCLYWEAESASVLGNLRRSIERRLRRAGLFLTSLHAVLPDFERAQLFVPLSATVIRWHLSRWGRRFVRHLLDMPGGAALAPLLAWSWRRHCAVTAIAWPGRQAVPSILGHPALSGQSIEDVLVVNREQTDATRRVIVFPFAKGSVSPAVVLKFWRLAWRHPEVEREQEAVMGLRSRLDPATRRSIPEPLGTLRWGNTLVGAESCAAGRPLLRTSARRRSRIRNLELVTDWLCAFHRQTASGPAPWSESLAEALVDEPLAAYERAFGGRPDEGLLFRAVRKRSRSLLGRPLALIQAHPDFSELNIYRHRGDICVIDWEKTQPGTPLCDLIYFVTLWHYHAQAERAPAAQRESFRRLFFRRPPDALGAAASDAFHRYMQALSIDPGFFPVFLVTTWVSRAEARFQRERITRPEGFERRGGNRHVGRVQILAESRERLFPEERG